MGARPASKPELAKRRSWRRCGQATVPLSLALALITQLVTSEVIGEIPAVVLSAVVALFIVGVWWILPLMTKRPRPRG